MDLTIGNLHWTPHTSLHKLVLVDVRLLSVSKFSRKGRLCRRVKVGAVFVDARDFRGQSIYSYNHLILMGHKNRLVHVKGLLGIKFFHGQGVGQCRFLSSAVRTVEAMSFAWVCVCVCQPLSLRDHLNSPHLTSHHITSHHHLCFSPLNNSTLFFSSSRCRGFFNLYSHQQGVQAAHPVLHQRRHWVCW